MQQRQAKPFLIAALLLLTGSFGGVLLANFTTGGSSAAAATSTWPSDLVENDSQPVLASAAPMDGPATYVCHGCGPSLAEQRALGDQASYDAFSRRRSNGLDDPTAYPAASAKDDAGSPQGDPAISVQ